VIFRFIFCLNYQGEKIKKYVAHFSLSAYSYHCFQKVSFLLAEKSSNLCNDHDNEINVLPQHAAYCSIFPELKDV
jgi:hypothetical protein